MDQQEFEARFGRRPSVLGNGRPNKKANKLSSSAENNFAQRIAGRCCQPENWSLPSKGRLWAMTRTVVPILGWLPRYSLSRDLHSDLVTGLTVGIMVVPQAMGYATLAKLDPVIGLYTCFFASLFYMFFGTSHHVSIGTFAVASMMVGALRAELLPDSPAANSQFTATSTSTTTWKLKVNGSVSPFEIPGGEGGEQHDHDRQQELPHGPIDFGYPVSPVMLTSALTFGVGLAQLAMATLRLTFLTTYISDPLVSGFTTGAAVHVLAAQLDKALGVRIPGANGPGMILLMLRDIVLAVPRANPVTVAISLVALLVLAIGRDVVGPWFSARFHLPLPIELALVIVAILASTQFGFKHHFGVRVVDHVPRGMPTPALPQLDLLRWTWASTLTIAVVCFVFVISLAKIFAKKHRYRIDPNQELRAIGFASLLSAFFPVYPFGASLSRSALCEMTGARTPLHALFSGGLLFVVILWLGPLLEPLPMAVLACIVIISLKSLFLQCRELPGLWAISRLDFATWMIAFLTTVGLNITWGLTLSVLSVLFFNVLREQWPRFWQLHGGSDAHWRTSNETIIFRPCALYADLSPVVVEEPVAGHTSPPTRPNHLPVQVWRWEAPLHFANADRFSERVSLLIQELSAPPVVAPLDAVLVSITPSTSAAASEGAGGGGVWQQQREKAASPPPSSSIPYMEDVNVDNVEEDDVEENSRASSGATTQNTLSALMQSRSSSSSSSSSPPPTSPARHNRRRRLSSPTSRHRASSAVIINYHPVSQQQHHQEDEEQRGPAAEGEVEDEEEMCRRPNNNNVLSKKEMTTAEEERTSRGCEGGNNKKKRRQQQQQSRAGGRRAATSPCLIIDCGAIPHVDSMGVEALAESVREARRCSVLLKHAALSDSILAVLDRCAQHQRFSVPRSVCYPSVREALRSVPAGDGPPPAGEGDGQQLQGERASSKGGGKF